MFSEKFLAFRAQKEAEWKVKEDAKVAKKPVFDADFLARKAAKEKQWAMEAREKRTKGKKIHECSECGELYFYKAYFHDDFNGTRSFRGQYKVNVENGLEHVCYDEKNVEYSVGAQTLANDDYVEWEQ